MQDSVNRPGFAKFFLESASEEREHAMKIIQYLLMRGELTSEIGSLIRDPVRQNIFFHIYKRNMHAHTHARTLHVRLFWD